MRFGQIVRNSKPISRTPRQCRRRLSLTVLLESESRDELKLSLREILIQ